MRLSLLTASPPKEPVLRKQCIKQCTSFLTVLFLTVGALLALSLTACGGGGKGSGGSDTLTVAGQAPADTASGIRDEPLTPSTLKDPRIDQLTHAEQRVLQDYVNRGIRRDSLEEPGSHNSLGGWLDSNLTVGEVIALYHGTEEIEPLPPEPLPPEPLPREPLPREPLPPEPLPQSSTMKTEDG